jgi:hypothetical protein
MLQDHFNRVHDQPVSCSEELQRFLYCEISFFDDGQVLISTDNSEMTNCCQLRRVNLSENGIGSERRMCDLQSTLPIDCSAYNGATGNGDVDIDGRVLSEVQRDSIGSSE